MPTVSLKELLTEGGTKSLPESYRVQDEYKQKFGAPVPPYLFQDTSVPTEQIVARIRAAIETNTPLPYSEGDVMAEPDSTPSTSEASGESPSGFSEREIQSMLASNPGLTREDIEREVRLLGF